MAWTWSYEPAPSAGDEAGAERSGEFPAQADAETWLGQEFQRLLDSGVESVTLFEGDRAVYGPMSLRP